MKEKNKEGEANFAERSLLPLIRTRRGRITRVVLEHSPRRTRKVIRVVTRRTIPKKRNQRKCVSTAELKGVKKETIRSISQIKGKEERCLVLQQSSLKGTS